MINVKRIGDHILPLPEQHHKGDAGYDLRSTIDKILIENEQVLIPIGFSFEIPFGYVGIIKDRSGMASKYRIYTSGGIIDSTYRGQIYVCIRNDNRTPYKISIGDRVAQMIIIPCLIGDAREVKQLSISNRDEDGFGSTGK